MGREQVWRPNYRKHCQSGLVVNEGRDLNGGIWLPSSEMWLVRIWTVGQNSLPDTSYNSAPMMGAASTYDSLVKFYQTYTAL